MVRSGASPRLPAAVAKSLANAVPDAVLARPAGRARAAARARRASSRPTWRSSAAGSPACGRRCWPRSATRPGDVVLLEARTVGWAASGRNGGFCSASLTHGIGNGLERFPDEMPLLEKLGEQNLQRDRRDDRQARHRLRLPADRGAERRHRRLAARGGRGGGGGRARARPRRRGARRRADPPRAQLAGCSSAGLKFTHRQRAGRAGQARLGAAPRLPGRGGADLRADAGHARSPPAAPG